MATVTNIDLGFPMRLFSLGCEPKPKKSINYHSKTEFLEDVENAVGEEVWKKIRDSPLGVIARFIENKFTWSSKVVEYLLVKQLVCKKKYELWCLFGEKPARFSLSEFADITTLNCAPFPDDCKVSEETKLHYGVLHDNENHWVGLFISIPNRSIDVFDCGWKDTKNADIVKAVKPIAHMLPHLLRAGAPALEKSKMSVEQYKIRRPRTKIPQMQKMGDCGIYAIKFVECHALDFEFTTSLSDANIKMVREKLAAEIFDETEQHGRTVSNPFPFGTNDRELFYPY